MGALLGLVVVGIASVSGAGRPPIATGSPAAGTPDREVHRAVIVWHDLEDERHAIQAAIPEAVSVWGSQDLDEREDRIIGFSDGEFRVLSTKPIIAGSGCNFQRHCAREVFAGVGHKDFLTPQLVRMLKPGRMACIHVKDRVLFQSVTGLGAPTMDYFHEEASFHLRRHGLVKMAAIVVTTDVVRENNQTYRLGYSEMLKDGTKMGTGCSEYVLVFRKPQTDLGRGYADDPVTHTPADYSLARWQVDAHNYWRSSGNRLLTAQEMALLGPGKLPKFFHDDSLRHVYDYERHVDIGEALAKRDALPKLFSCLAQGSPDHNVWTDVVRMRTLNGEQASRAVEKHLCPLQLDIVDRLIERFSNRGDLVYDPFHGLGTVGVRAIKLGRRAGGSELNGDYFRDQVHYLQAAEREFATPTLFDLEEELAA